MKRVCCSPSEGLLTRPLGTAVQGIQQPHNTVVHMASITGVTLLEYACMKAVHSGFNLLGGASSQNTQASPKSFPVIAITMV